MRYEVEWDPQCFAQFDEIAAQGVTYDQLKDAVRQIDAKLSVDPLTKGQLLSEGLYLLDVLPLRVYFHIDSANRTAVVDGIRRIGA
jgi:hypothetical protein